MNDSKFQNCDFSSQCFKQKLIKKKSHRIGVINLILNDSLILSINLLIFLKKMAIKSPKKYLNSLILKDRYQFKLDLFDYFLMLFG